MNMLCTLVVTNSDLGHKGFFWFSFIPYGNFLSIAFQQAIIIFSFIVNSILHLHILLYGLEKG